MIAVLAVLVAVLVAAPAAHAGTLRAGAGRADITPPTGFYMMGWVRSDAVMEDQRHGHSARAKDPSSGTQEPGSRSRVSSFMGAS